MFQLNDDLSIYATRGDIVFFSVSASEDGVPYHFQPGDVVRIKVFAKKNAEDVVLQKYFPVTENTENLEIFLNEADTKIGEVISKPVDYWYEIELNPDTDPQTIIGYDENGAKVFKLFPEGADIDEAYEPSEEDFPVVDEELDLTSPRPVANRAVAAEIELIKRDSKKDYVTPQMFGAVGDGVADDTQAIQDAINSLEGNQRLLIPDGEYMCSSVMINKNHVRIDFDGTLIQKSGVADPLLVVKGNSVYLDCPKVTRECTQSGVAASDLVGIGIRLTDSKNVCLVNPRSTNFGVGIEVHSNSSVGCAYIEIYNPFIVALEGIKSTHETSGSWTNEVHVYGGRFSIHSTYTDYTGSAYCNINGNAWRFNDVVMEGKNVERKIKGAYSFSSFIGCRFEEINKSGTDIDITGDWNAFRDNYELGVVVNDIGQGNDFDRYAVHQFGKGISRRHQTVTENTSISWKYPIVLADCTSGNITLQSPNANNQAVNGVEFTVKKIDATSNHVYVYTRPNSPDNEDVSANLLLTEQNESITIFSNGERWYIKSWYKPSVMQ